MSQPRPHPHMPPQGYGWPPHPHPEAVFVNQAPRDTSVTKLTVPAVMVIGVCLFLIGATYHATTQFAEIRHALEKLNEKMDRIASDLSSRVDRVEREGWTKTDQQLWCSRAEQVNPAWRCADNAVPFRREAPVPTQPRLDSWKPKN